MKKIDFLLKLRKSLHDLPEKEIDERISFYSEMISDRMEEGLSEEEAVAAVGGKSAINDIEAIDGKDEIYEEEGGKRKLSGKELAIIIGGSPLWAPLGIAAVAVIFSLIVSLWAVIVSLWAAFASFAICAPASLIFGIFLSFKGYFLTFMVLLSASLVLSGLAILSYFGFLYLTKESVILTKKTYNSLINIFKRRERAK